MELSAMAVGLRRRWRRIRRAAASGLARVAPRAVALLPAQSPLHVVHHGAARRPAERLVVFLPGIGDVADDFAARGFVAAVTSEALAADAVAVDAHYGYYASRSVLERLAHDVVLPARERGYRDVWLVGISMGGAGAIAYATRHPDHVSRVLLLAPYLGEAKLVRDIAAGVPHPRGHADAMRDVWRRLERPAASGLPLGKLYLGYGTRDRFAKAHALLAARLPRQHVRTMPGGHDWRTWRRLWDAFVADWAPSPVL